MHERAVSFRSCRRQSRRDRRAASSAPRARRACATIAVYSDADADAPHVRDRRLRGADRPAPAAHSYLVDPALIAAAKSARRRGGPSGLRLSCRERRFRAKPARDAGLVFIGPSPGDARDGRQERGEVGAWSPRACRARPAITARTSRLRASPPRPQRIGFPVMIKASAGGGGRGMRIVRETDDLEAALPRRAPRPRAPSATAAPARARADRRAPCRGAGVRRRTRHDRAPRRTRLFDPAPASEDHRGSALARGLARPARSDGRGGGQGGAGGRLCRRGHGRVPAGRDGRVLFSRDEHAHPGRASRHRMRHRPRSGAPAIAHRAGRGAADRPERRHAQRPCDRGAALRGRPGGGLPAGDRDIVVWRPGQGEGVRIDHGLAEGVAVSPYYDSLLAKIIAMADRARRRAAGSCARSSAR